MEEGIIGHTGKEAHAACTAHAAYEVEIMQQISQPEKQKECPQKDFINL
jgi:hypothetical protein